ncbi:MAG: shikimate dehydrogenase family protein [Streptosporangiaceae bacterium]
MLGSPIRHSLSPALHTAAYRELGLTDWSYDAIECDANGLAGLLASLGPEWAGLSLTMPLKQAVLPLLDEAEQLVMDVGGANTVLLRAGRRAGYSTDVPGMVAALREAGVGVAGRAGGAALCGGVLVLGGGATACSALAALHRAGASDVTVAVRDSTRAGQLREVAGRLGLRLRLAGLTEDGVRLGQARSGGPEQEASGCAGAGPGWQLVLSTVPAGAADGVAGQIAAGEFGAAAVFDVVYDPWPTALAVAATAKGSTVISGFELLLHQAAGQVELMTGRPAPLAAMSAAGLAEIARRQGQR